MESVNFATRTIGELVAEDYRLASVFKKYGIDFCCGGGRTVEAACMAKKIDYDTMERELFAATQGRDTTGQSQAAGWDLDFLADYIVNIHHRYVRESIPLLLEFTTKVARVHGHANPEVVAIAELFEEVAAEMSSHIVKEEEILFPQIKRLVAAQRNGASPEAPAFGTVQNPIRVMEHEHDRAGDLMKRIAILSNQYTPPEHACNTYRVSFAKLQEFEDDLHRHVHLENNILFPRAALLEENLFAA